MKKKNRLFYLVLAVISILYLFLRLWNLNNLITFHIDQGIQLSEAYQVVANHKIPLIGPMVISKTFEGRGFFIGPFYTYSLALLGIIFNWIPLNITAFLIFLEFSYLFLFLIWLSRKYSHPAIAVIFFLIATCPFLIEHSRFFWNPHFLLPLSFLFLFFLEKRKYFFSAIVWGLAFSFHYSAALWAIPLLIYLSKNKEKLYKYLLCIPGFLLGDLPWFLFEFKHNFYNIKTMFLVFINTNKAGELSAYYFVFSFSVFLIFLLLKISKKSSRVFYLLSALILIFNLYYQLNLKEKLPVGMPDGWTYPVQQKVVEMITQNNCPQNYNVATTISGDTQAHDLRYLLTTKNCPPNNVDNYPNSSTIFLIAPPDRIPKDETVWEISSFNPFKITKTVKINDNIYFYQLDK